jgi:hypothetical protein
MKITRAMKLQAALLLADIIDGEVQDLEALAEFCEMLAKQARQDLEKRQ